MNAPIDVPQPRRRPRKRAWVIALSCAAVFATLLGVVLVPAIREARIAAVRMNGQ